MNKILYEMVMKVIKPFVCVMVIHSNVFYKTGITVFSMSTTVCSKQKLQNRYRNVPYTL